MTAKKPKILFLCTGNSCRSQMAEAICRHVAVGVVEAHSAGSRPAGYVHPLAREAMELMRIPMVGQASKSWDQYADLPVDVVITVCDQAAGEACPVWPGDPIRVAWFLPDPAGFPGTAEERVEFALRIAERLRARIELMARLDWSADRAELCEQLRLLGEL